MDLTTILVLLIVAAAVGVVAVAAILDRDRTAAAQASRETQFASSTEGMRRCPSCGVGQSGDRGHVLRMREAPPSLRSSAPSVEGGQHLGPVADRDEVPFAGIAHECCARDRGGQIGGVVRTNDRIGPAAPDMDQWSEVGD